MQSLGEFQTLALAKVRSPDFRERLTGLFHRFTLAEARDIVQATNRLRGGRDAVIEKGAVGEAVVAAAMHHYFGEYDGRGFFDFQYEYWGPHGIDERYPARTMDIVFIMPAKVPRGSVTFQVEAKNYSHMTLGHLTGKKLAPQIQKDIGYLNPKIPGHAPLIPVWWFLQGLNAEARYYLEVQGVRVVDFNGSPFRPELDGAFRTGP